MAEQCLLSNLPWIERAIPPMDRWFLVFRRYIEQTASRVDGPGCDSSKVAPSPSADWRWPLPGGATCRPLEIVTTALLGIFLGATSGTLQVVLGLFVLAILFAVGYA